MSACRALLRTWPTLPRNSADEPQAQLRCNSPLHAPNPQAHGVRCKATAFMTCHQTATRTERGATGRTTRFTGPPTPFSTRAISANFGAHAQGRAHDLEAVPHPGEARARGRLSAGTHGRQSMTPLCPHIPYSPNVPYTHSLSHIRGHRGHLYRGHARARECRQ